MRRFHTKYLMISVAASLILTDPGLADVDLRQAPTVGGNMITIGDIFSGADLQAETVIDKAPMPGSSTRLSAKRLSRIITDAGLDWQIPAHIKYVTVKRSGIRLAKDMVMDMVSEAGFNAGVTGNRRYGLYGTLRGIYLPTDFDPGDITIEQFEIDDRVSRFSAILITPTGTAEYKETRLTGKIEEVRKIPVLSRALIPGEVIQENDISWKELPANRVNHTVVQSTHSLIGQTVRRPLQANFILRLNDIQKPIAVAKGAYVTMAYTIGNLQLAASGRALENGGVGDIIRLMNPQSKQTVEGKVTGPDKVAVLTGAGLVAARR